MLELLKNTAGLSPWLTIHSMMAVEQGAQQQCSKMRSSLRSQPSGSCGVKVQVSNGITRQVKDIVGDLQTLLAVGGIQFRLKIGT
jgi:hypothetical protein